VVDANQREAPDQFLSEVAGGELTAAPSLRERQAALHASAGPFPFDAADLATPAGGEGLRPTTETFNFKVKGVTRPNQPSSATYQWVQECF
jgi:hypothetical protein